ncbi:hypothetical protein G6660_05730 [Polynucleobacter paneuropaeus]|nr:hypothetical protein [Polynucleobacter paneuropaeus]
MDNLDNVVTELKELNKKVANLESKISANENLQHTVSDGVETGLWIFTIRVFIVLVLIAIVGCVIYTSIKPLRLFN